MKTFNNLFFVVAMFLVTSVAFSQGTITGTVVDQSGPLPGASVVVKGTTNGTSTNFDGKFSLDVNSASGTIQVSYIGYDTKSVTFNVSGGTKDLGTITLVSNNSLDEVIIVGSGIIDLAEDRKTPIAVSTIKKREIQERAVGNVELPEIIKYTPSVFVSRQTGFGDGRLLVRGFDDTNTAVLLNGQPINAQEDGRVFWSNWAGMADIANAVQVQRGLGASKLAISSVGGTVNIVMKAAEKKKGGSVRFLTGNDSYFKGTAEYNTGVNEKGWAFSVLIDHWQAHRRWAEGTFGQGQNYFFSVGYKPNERHNFNFLITGAPQYHGQKWSQRVETTLNDPKFNQHWGYTSNLQGNNYTSDIDSERRNFYHKPVMNINWDWNISEKSDLSTVLYASWGRGGGTGPRGDGRLRDPNGQIDYFAIEQSNQAIGVATGGDDGPGYIRRASMNNHAWYGIVSNFNHEVNENFAFNVGTDLRYYVGDHFRQVANLYGLTAWEEDGVSYTTEYNPDPWAALFNFADEGDRLDYDYSETITYQGLFAQGEYSTDRFSAFFQGAVSNQTYQREGRFQGDLGKSDNLSKIGYNLKAGLGYEFAEDHKIYLNTGHYSRQPYLDNVFTNIRRSNALVQPEVDNEEITGFEAGYQFEVPGVFRAIFNFYHTDWDNRVLLSGGTITNTDGSETNINVFERGVRQVHRGVELELDSRPTDWLDLRGFVSAGSWQFKGNSNVQVYNDDTNVLISSTNGVNRDGVKITTAPQFTAGATAKARIISGLSADVNFKYYSNHYSNDRDFDGTPQTRNFPTLDAFELVDLGVTYDFSIGENKLTFRANVFNAFDKRGIQDTDQFGSFPITGRTFNTSLRYHF
ncbi:carboxypeptidase-like regulatory domain-containing protein [uncultured Kordia sp.]|uniref:TonB-dependent receptor n=1 Tax=uncultured Kordia sp. TaxID=507699 RepID=UPI002638DB80|nr:carboxypeptidase-like regulatory domain-containing protein [uncultured Kordia sp.]